MKNQIFTIVASITLLASPMVVNAAPPVERPGVERDRTKDMKDGKGGTEGEAGRTNHAVSDAKATAVDAELSKARSAVENKLEKIEAASRISETLKTVAKEELVEYGKVVDAVKKIEGLKVDKQSMILEAVAEYTAKLSNKLNGENLSNLIDGAIQAANGEKAKIAENVSKVLGALKEATEGQLTFETALEKRIGRKMTDEEKANCGQRG